MVAVFQSMRFKLNIEKKAYNRIDLTGKVYGRLKVNSVSHREGKVLYWNCTCECGNATKVRSQPLRNGSTKSCGCLQSELQKSVGDITRTHGMKHTETYVIWERMKSRCYYIKDISYKNYGALGIVVCDSWKNSFENFYNDMGKKPVGMSLDRINTSKNYSKENCRWADRTTQNRNRRNNIIVELHGSKKVLSQLSEETGIKYGTLYKRIIINGMDVEKAIA